MSTLISDMKSIPKLDRELKSIFIGGGTPSLLAPINLERLLEIAAKLFNLSKSIEITIEVNPETLTLAKAQAYKALGINRLSIGVQSFCNNKLLSLGRIHTAETACEAIVNAKKAGFENINFDMMYALPEQTVENALEDIKAAINYEPTHISWYQLTIEPNTPFAALKPKLPSENEIEDMHESGIDLLENKGFKRYEISAFARIKCNHNLNYWQFGDYLGIGVSAHGKTTKNGQVIRYEKTKDLDLYLAGTTTIKHTLTPSDLTIEFMLNALRLIDGFPLSLFEERTGLPYSAIENELKKAAADGFIQIENSWIKPTTQGLRFLNTALEYFL